MWIDTHLLYVMVMAAAWLVCIAWICWSIYTYDLYHIIMSIVVLFTYPILFELLLDIWGFLTSSSLRFTKHKEDCDKTCEFKFPIIYSGDYPQSLLWMETMHGIDHQLPYYVYRLLEEEEVLDSKEEEAEWYLLFNSFK